MRPRLLIAAVVVACSTLAGCSTAEPGGAETEPAATTPPATPPSSTPGAAAGGELPDELQRSWLIRVEPADIRDRLAESGFGRYTDRFLAVEKLPNPGLLVLTYDDSRFEIAYYQRDGTWQVGWWGGAAVQGDLLTMHDDYFDIDDRYRWRVVDDRLVLTFERTTAVKVHAIPSEAYSRVYFARPLPAADCTPDDLDACLP